MNITEKSIVETTPVLLSSTAGLIDFNDFDSWSDDLISQRWNYPVNKKFHGFPKRRFSLSEELPKEEIIDHENEIKIQVKLPDIKKEDVDVSINNQTVTIRASVKKDNEGYFRREISRGEFQRTLFLFAQIDSEKATASFKDGMLEVTLPKSEKSKRKTIEIK